MQTKTKDKDQKQGTNSMPTVLVADEISKEGLDIMSAALDVVYKPDVTPEQLLTEIAGVDAVLVRSRSKITADVIKHGKKLKLIGRAGVGVDNIDLNAATEAGIVVVNSPEGNTASAAEHAVALMFSMARLIPAADASMKNGKWERNKFLGSELFNKTLGVIGLGKVGSRVAQAAQGVGMKVLGYDPLISADRAARLNITSVGLDEIWAKADYITIHTPKTRETTSLINEQVLQKVKPGVRIVNTARGGIIDEKALADAIRDGRVAAAALDVFEQEPPADQTLADLGDKVILTPHLGASTVEAQFNVAIDLAEQIRDYLTDGIMRSPVNMPYMRPEIVALLGRFIFLAETMGAIASELCEGNVKEVEVVASGSLAQKDIAPLVVAALRGVFASKIEGVTYVNSMLVAKNHGIQVRETKSDDRHSGDDKGELGVRVVAERSTSTISGTLLAQDEPIITRINEFPINLMPHKYMLFTSHRDQPGMVAKVAGILGAFDINISTMSVARKNAREEAVMVMTLDDPLNPVLVTELNDADGINMARFVALDFIK